MQKLNLAFVIVFALAAAMLLAKAGTGYGFSGGHF